MYEEPATLNPILSTITFEDDVYQLLFDGLIRIDNNGRPAPDLAVAVPTTANGGISHDGKTITYHLMPNVRWHDGVPLTSADVVYTWQQIMNPNNSVVSRAAYEQITSIDTPNALTVRLHLRSAFAPAIYLFANGAIGSIIPKHLLQRYPSLNVTPFNSQPVGSGPYVFRSWDHGSTMRFDANTAYFRTRPKIPHVVVKFIPDQNTLLNALRTHEIDVYYSQSPLQAGEVRNVPDTTFRQSPSVFYEHLTFNTQRAPLNERAVRLALCYDFDQPMIFQKIYRGLGGIGPTHYSPLILGWDPSIHYYPYDPSKANAILDAAGWKRGPDGVRTKNGKPLAFTISTVAGVKLREELEVVLQRYWQSIGARVTIKNYVASLFFAPAGEHGPLYSGDTDVSIFTSYEGPDPDDENVLSPDRLPPAGQNVSRFVDAEAGRLVVEGVSSNDRSYREPIYKRLGHILIDNVPEYVLSWVPQITSSNIDLHGVLPNPVGSDLSNVASWYFGSGTK
jgi:peptide/nickel transport system substrate-binding protein